MKVCYGAAFFSKNKYMSEFVRFLIWPLYQVNHGNPGNQGGHGMPGKVDYYTQDGKWLARYKLE